MRYVRKLVMGGITLILAGMLVVPVSQARQDTPDVYAEAIGQANLRSGPGVDYAVVGEITAGTHYRVLARHTLVPWLQLEVPGTSEAWVYTDLVTVYGNLAAVPPVSDFAPIMTATSTATLTPVPAPASANVDPLPVLPENTWTATSTPAASLTATLALSPTPTVEGPIATTLGEANVRFGPDLQYPVIVKVAAGRSFRVLERHALYPWTRVALDESPTGSGWLYNDVIEISGDLSLVPMTNTTRFAYPTLTPTPQTVIVNGAPWANAPLASGQLASTLGVQMHNYLLQQGFQPFSDRLASVFVMDLKTGDSFTINDNVAFSGMSLTKIAILATYFKQTPGPLSADQAFLVADTMMCSENITTNQLLEQIGDGDALRGAQRVTAFLQGLGLNGTFLMRQYVLDPDEPPLSVGTIQTGADQISAQPDQSNQVVPKDLGWLLAGIYQCAQDGSGLLTERYPGDFDAQKCRRMLYAMDANQINVFLEAGVPVGTRVIHKHGWIDDTHGDAGIVIGPDTAYVFVAVLYGRDWLEFDTSTQVIAELARMTWNTLNPSQPLDATRPGVVPAECDPRSGPVMTSLMSSNLPMLGP
jgi:uncharacterized protein YraI/beta-lactamase class A